jgi:two-component system nitrogen regulation response regulator GlnG
LTSLIEGRAVQLSRVEPDFLDAASSRQRPLGDPYLSRKPILLGRTEHGISISGELERHEVAVEGSQIRSSIEVAQEDLALGVVIELSDRIALMLHDLSMPRRLGPELGLVGQSDAIRLVREEILRAAPQDAPILLRGESGTGKELVAQAIHDQSPRRERPFVTVNMAAIPATTAVAELFGHTKGAFTGATRSAEGYFGAAHRGTLLLDEVGDTPPEIQAMMLRALESGEIQPVGAHQVRQVDVRWIAATEIDLEHEVESGRFRAALYHRLAGLEIFLPPLRRRRDDIARLLILFLRDELAKVGAGHLLDPPIDRYTPPWLGAKLVSSLVRHGWPGNVRQLRNVARRLALACGDLPAACFDPSIERLLAEGTPSETSPLDQRSPIPAKDLTNAEDDTVPVEEITEEMLASTLRECDFQPGAAAAKLGIGRTTIYKLIDQSTSIRKAADIPDAELEQCWTSCEGDIESMSRQLEVSERALKLRLRRLNLE